MIFLKIKDNFPTQEFLGPVIVNRPELESVPGGVSTGVDSSAFSRHPSSFRSEVVGSDECHKDPDGLTDCDNNKLPSLAKEGCQPASADGVVCSDKKIKESAILLGPSSLEPTRSICLGPIRLKFDERFPIVSLARSRRAARPAGMPAFQSQVLDAHLGLPPWAATQAGMLALQSTSGLSPPPAIGERGHSASKDVPWPLAIEVETRVSHLDL